MGYLFKQGVSLWGSRGGVAGGGGALKTFTYIKQQVPPPPPLRFASIGLGLFLDYYSVFPEGYLKDLLCLFLYHSPVPVITPSSGGGWGWL